MTAPRSNGANSADRACTDPSFRRFFPSRFFPNLFIYLLLEKKIDSIRIESTSVQERLLLFGVTRRKRRAFLGSIPSLPAIDPAGRCGESRTLILIVASRLVARSSTGYRYTRRAAVQKVTQEVGNVVEVRRACTRHRPTRDAFRAALKPRREPKRKIRILPPE